MTLYEIVNIFKKIALDQPNIRSTSDGSVYDALNNNPSVKYDVFHISQTNHQEDFETDYYGLQLFYISRLEDSLEDNRLQIQSIGKEVLGNIIRTFCENFSIDYPTITYIPFTQKFNDLTAGQYCNVRLEVPKDLVCADDYVAEVVPGSGIKLQNIGITITENGLRVITPGPGYDGIGEIRIETDVPQSAAILQDKEVEYTENGSYTIHPDAGYDGLSSVAVDVIVPQGQGYEEGYEDGVADQKAKLSTTSVTENGTYTREDGYSAITVNVPQGQGYEEGYEDGEAAQKAKLVSTAVTENGTYSKEDGYSAITVNVPSDYQDGYDDGYEDGYAAGASACSELFITAITLNVDSAITDSATATTTFAPLTSITDIYYTSSDPSIATIDPVTGVITAVSNGSVTICTNDRWTGLQDCKSVTVTVTEPSLNMPLTMHIIQAGNIVWKTNDASFATTIQYKKNDGNWTNITATTGGTVIPVVSGDTLWFRGNNSQYALGANIATNVGTESSHNSFSGSSATFEVSNNVMSLINSNNFATLKTFSSNYALAGLFAGCSGLTNAENLLLPATSLTRYCYSSMFKKCRYLVSAPSLPATSLAYACYEAMFDTCVRLNTAPSILPALTLQPYCYSNMFSNCTGLTTAPELPAKTLVDYCYMSMFERSFNLKNVKCLATNISAFNCTHYWLLEVSSAGTFVKNPNMSSWPRGEDGIPTGWTVVDNS